MATTDDRDHPTDLLNTGREGTQRVPVNMYETDDALVIVAPMPGVTADDIEIIVEADQLTVRAQLRAPAAKKNYVMHEWDYGGYERSVPLPQVFHGDVTASLGHGQLAISVSRQGDRPTGARHVLHPSSVR
jgi:HSP20 family protein